MHAVNIMYICLCQGITDSQIRDAVGGGATSLKQVRNQLGVMNQCGKCGLMTKKVMEQTLAEKQMDQSESLYYAIA